MQYSAFFDASTFTAHIRRTLSGGSGSRIFLGLLSVLAAADTLHAQGRRCEVKYTNVSSGQCLDIGTLNGRTITLPSNTTRMDNLGLSLCKRTQQADRADIVFIVDQSGSMGLRLAYINGAGTDTTFYETTSGCQSTATSGTVTIQTYNNAGDTTKVTRNLPRLTNNAGCTAYSGDPYKARATAVEQAIDYIAIASPGSTAGYLPFAGGIQTPARSQRPLVLTAANIATLKGKILIDSAGATNYNRPVDSANRWLNNPALAPNTKKAIIFISDGAPNPADSNGLRFITANTPPIYSIYLSKLVTPDTARLKILSDSTRGAFFRVPGTRPDSLISVIRSILNVVLAEYSPVNVVVTNNSLVPPKADTSDAANFQLQGDGSWLIPLKDPLPLNANAANQLSVVSTFKQTQTQIDSTQTVGFTLSTTGPEQATSTTIDGNFSVVCYDRASLDILDQAGNPFPAPGYISDANNAFTVRVTTSQTGLSQITPVATTFAPNAAATDRENIALSNSAPSGANFLFSGTKPFSIIPQVNQNGVVEAAAYDTLIVTWQNPRDPNDIASRKVPVRPTAKQARAYFSTNAGGTDTTTTYPATATTVYLIVLDQPLPTGTPATAIVSTTRGNLPVDTARVTLTLISSGKYGVAIPVDLTTTVNRIDTRLQLNSGDQIKAVFQDPLNSTEPEAVANAGFGVAGELTGLVEFTDATGAALPPGTYWSPSNDSIYIKYTDDTASVLNTLPATLSVLNNRGAAPADAETVSMTRRPAERPSASTPRDIWRGAIALRDLLPATQANNTVEIYVLGQVTASIPSHLTNGTPDAAATGNLNVAYPNENAVLTLLNAADTALGIDRATGSILIKVEEQSLSSLRDTLSLTATCASSGDAVPFKAIETAAGSGQYESAPFPKNEGSPAAGDGALSCRSQDLIRISYTDPVYGNPHEITRSLGDTTAVSITYALDDLGQVTTDKVSGGGTFYAIITAPTPVIDKIDTLELVFNTTQEGTTQTDRESFMAIETGPSTGVFVAEVPYGFTTVENVTQGNGKLEGKKLSSTDATATTVAEGAVTVNGITTKKFISMLDANLPPGNIQKFRGFPPVAGLDASSPDFAAVNQVANRDTSGSYASWIPPVSFLPSSPDDAPSGSGDLVNTRTAIPDTVSTIEVVSVLDGSYRYVAQISIFDNLGNFVNSFSQSFGYQGEFSNASRLNWPRGEITNYLSWNMRDKKGQRVGQGVYTWRVVFKFSGQNGTETRFIRTGVVRKK